MFLSSPRARWWFPVLLALASGALAVLGFAPVALFPIAIVALAGFFESLRRASPRTAWWRGWAFGIGLLGVGVAWIRISLNQFGNMDAWIADLLTAVFVLTLAIFYALAGSLTRRLERGDARWTTPVLLFPGLFVVFEWLRGWLFTGFPWLAMGYTQIDGPLGGYAPIAGVYGVSLLAAVSGGLLWGLVRWPRTRARIAAGAALVVIWASGSLLGTVAWTEPSGEPFEATVVQANIPQAIKWDPDARLQTIQAYLEMTRDHLGSGLIVWPETAVTDFLHRVRDPILDPLSQRAREEGSEIVLGIPVLDQDTGAYYNALLSIGGAEDLYAKRHLVPFGEFLPFKQWLGPLVELFDVPMSDFSPGAASRPTLRVGERLAGVSICYEDAFPAEVIQALPEAEYLINVSNDGWFGDSLAPYQHLEIARMRALETGRYLVRATNTGISAIIDNRGAVLGTVPAFVRGPFSAQVEPRSGATPFVRVGNWLAIGLALGMIAAAFLSGRRGRRGRGDSPLRDAGASPRDRWS